MAGRSFKLDLILQAKDNASAQLKSLGNSINITKGQLIAIGAVATAASAALVAGALKAANAAGIQQQQEILLAQAMQQAGVYTEKAFQENLKFASSLQKVTTFGDEAILGVQRMLTNFGLEGEMLNKVTKATLDLAVAKGMDLKAAADLVAKSIGSSTNALTRYGIEVTGAAGSTERAQTAVNNITKLFGGAAQAEAQSYLGQIKQLKNQWGDIVEQIGKAVIPIMITLINVIKNNVLPLLENWTKNLGETTKGNEIFGKGLQWILKIVTGIIAAFDIAGNAVVVFLLGISRNFDAAKIAWEELQNKVVEHGEIIKSLSEEQVDLTATSYDAMTAKIIESNAIQTESEIAKNETIKQSFLELMAAQAQAQIDWNAKAKALVDGFLSSTSTGFQTMAKNIFGDWRKLGDGMTQIGQGIRDALIKHFADIAAKWVVQTAIMKSATLAWKAIEVSASAAVAAARAAAASAWSLFGAIGIGAAIGAAVLAFKNQFADGVKNFQGGLAMVGERGRELINLPRGTDVIPNAQTENILNGMQGRTAQKVININIDFSQSQFMGDEDVITKKLTDNIMQELLLQGNY